MIGQSEAANSSLEDITIVTKAQYNETAAARAVGGSASAAARARRDLALPRHQPAVPVIFEQLSKIEGRE
jgi:hypothetical protein